ncbi:MAG: helix-turn-helix domain-containing protein [Candidatus Adiutrix sp.]|jgi:predicted transcriptional regulator|nr:helix-turn-helix domain-containing protein [Candidatus Adiutrix sp.]
MSAVIQYTKKAFKGKEGLSKLVAKLGGELVIDDEVVTVPPMPEEERVGRMLRGLRLRAGMTQKELAAAIGVPQSHVSEYEKSKRAIPRGKARELAKVLKTVTANFLPRA